ncbi:hypothetical protein [Butyrivibrio sp. XPD2002]|uniref:hypothetical protein n=1 Tax=Butyrivibrio sp. XPD2002 TaxID=1280665 RepID=UPI0003F7FA58|nr:hypothetical protein [Butyrivibrio sp. XPD2002]
MNLEEIILSLIPKGHEKAISGTKLDILADTEERDRKRTIEHLRKHGYLICANNNGYFIAETMDELKDYVRTVKRRIKTTGETIRKANKIIKRYDSQIKGQLSLDCLGDDYEF